MSLLSRAVGLACGAVLIVSPVAAQRTSLPPLRPLGRIIATAVDSIRQIENIRSLSDGRLLVDDDIGDRVLLLDATLRHSTVIIGTAGVTPRSYPKMQGVLLRYLGDSSIFVDRTAVAFLVIDPGGNITRIVAPPIADVEMFAHTPAGLDAAGRLVFSAAMRPVAGHATARDPSPEPVWPESALVLRVSLVSRRLDTLAYVRTPTVYPRQKITDSLGFTWSIETENPVPVHDAWASLSDGTIAVVRAQDFHIDWVSPDGIRSSSKPLPHVWQRWSDSDKAAMVDSARRYLDVHSTGTQCRAENGVRRCHVDHAGLPDPSDLPDYQAPFMNVLADAEDNLWIREMPTPESARGTIYDRVNRAGEMFDRVQLPGATWIEGFGPGVVYLSASIGNGVSLARARIR
ncbi:MAG TPA: hypothetical protein VMH39_01345 [Gemmatimonadaceae bacterium]|nr:hypothetical protein [Gemmatimonadaceae bacterium]